MKKTYLLILPLILPALTFSQPVQLWEFNDAAGTILEETVNTGTPGSAVWSAGFGASTTNGSGLFIINDADGNAFKTAPMGTGEGMLTYEFIIHSWDLDEQNDPAAQSFRNFGVRLRDNGAGSNVMNFQVQQQGNGNLRFRISDNNGITNQVVGAYDGLPMVSTTIYTVQLMIDTATGAWTLNINNDTAIASGTAIVGNLDTLNFYKQGAYGGGSTPDFVAIEEISLSGPVASVTWAGYDVDDLGWANTTPWLGFVNVLADPWIWSASINNWMYMPEEGVGEGGSWAYVLGQ
ncbi:MAG: hypothetical protein AB3N64_10625 [Puniceicoccaceae bacterium]